jgi:Fe-S-cluster containining protein
VEDLDAGDFSLWLAATRATLRDGGDADVPCSGCTACCTSAQFVHIDPDETDTLAHIPSELLVPAPGRSAGHAVLGYDENGHCPMLRDGACSIYEHRPRACRMYDCRVFAATGIEPGVEKPRLVEHVRRWRFRVISDDDRTRRDAVREAAAAASGTAGAPAASPTQIALTAITGYERYLPPEVGVELR